MEPTTIAILAGLAFLPPVAFALWVRAHEKHQREPVMAVLGMFAYGGTLGVISALVLSVLLGLWIDPDFAGFVGLVVIAPLAEELSKGFGLGFVRGRILELEDGIIYGAAIGLGFGATENLLYGLSAFDEGGLDNAVLVLCLRVVSSALLHAGSTALLGYGYALARLRGQGLGMVLPFYLLAVIQHAAYNFLVSVGYLIAFGAAIAMVITVTTLLRRQVRRLDRLQGWTTVR